LFAIVFEEVILIDVGVAWGNRSVVAVAACSGGTHKSEGQQDFS